MKKNLRQVVKETVIENKMDKSQVKDNLDIVKDKVTVEENSKEITQDEESEEIEESFENYYEKENINEEVKVVTTPIRSRIGRKTKKIFKTPIRSRTEKKAKKIFKTPIRTRVKKILKRRTKKKLEDDIDFIFGGANTETVTENGKETKKYETFENNLGKYLKKATLEKLENKISKGIEGTHLDAEKEISENAISENLDYDGIEEIFDTDKEDTISKNFNFEGIEVTKLDTDDEINEILCTAPPGRERKPVNIGFDIKSNITVGMITDKVEEDVVNTQEIDGIKEFSTVKEKLPEKKNNSYKKK